MIPSGPLGCLMAPLLGLELASNSPPASCSRILARRASTSNWFRWSASSNLLHRTTKKKKKEEPYHVDRSMRSCCLLGCRICLQRSEVGTSLFALGLARRLFINRYQQSSHYRGVPYQFLELITDLLQSTLIESEGLAIAYGHQQVHHHPAWLHIHLRLHILPFASYPPHDHHPQCPRCEWQRHSCSQPCAHWDQLFDPTDNPTQTINISRPGTERRERS